MTSIRQGRETPAFVTIQSRTKAFARSTNAAAEGKPSLVTQSSRASRVCYPANGFLAHACSCPSTSLKRSTAR